MATVAASRAAPLTAACAPALSAGPIVAASAGGISLPSVAMAVPVLVFLSRRPPGLLLADAAVSLRRLFIVHFHPIVVHAFHDCSPLL